MIPAFPDTPEAMVKKDIEVFQIMKKEPDGAHASAIDVLKWWNEMIDRFLCLQHVVKLIHGIFARSGVLELDIGSSIFYFSKEKKQHLLAWLKRSS